VVSAFCLLIFSNAAEAPLNNFATLLHLFKVNSLSLVNFIEFSSSSFSNFYFIFTLKFNACVDSLRARSDRSYKIVLYRC